MEQRIFVFGEVLWDMLPSGKKLGGAPANFAYHVAKMGAESILCSRVGNDSLGSEIRSIFKKQGLSCKYIDTDPRLPTGTVSVDLNDEGQPTYSIIRNVAWDNIEASDELLDQVRSATALYFGSLAFRMDHNLQTFYRILDEIPPTAKRVFDINLRAPFYNKDIIAKLLRVAEFFKLSHDELLTLFQMFKEETPFSSDSQYPIDDKEVRFSPSMYQEAIEEQLLAFMHYFDLKNVALTCGSNGSFLFDNLGNSSWCPVTKTTMADSVGAGDAFTAVCTQGLLCHRPLGEINAAASRYAAYVCSQSGGMPDIPNDIIPLFE